MLANNASSATCTHEEYHSHSRVVSLALACKRDVALNLYHIKCTVEVIKGNVV